METSNWNNENIFLLRRANVWYTTCDGSWNDPNIWISNALDKRNVLLPQAGDTVYVNHTVDYGNILSTSSYLFNNTINDLYIGVNGVLTSNSNSTNQNLLIVNGTLECTGLIDFSGAVRTITLQLSGSRNYIANFSAGTQSIINYSSQFDQTVCPVNYFNLTTSGSGTKYLQADLVANGAVTIGSALQLGAFNYIAFTTVLGGPLLKNSSTGAVNFTTITSSGSLGSVAFTGNPTVNIAGNFTGDIRGGVNFGSGTLNVTANSTWTINGPANIAEPTGTNNVVISSGVTLTIAPSVGANGGGWINNGSITGASNTSTLNINGTYAYGNNNAAMPTGIFNYNNSGTSMIQVQSGVTMALPFTSFYALNIGGMVTLSGNTTVGNNLTLTGSLELAAYDFTCSGTCYYAGSLLKSGNGTVNLNVLSPQNSTGSISFTGSPTVNLSGSISGDSRAGINLGAGTVNIVSSINIGVWVGGNVALSITWNILIASGVTLTNTGMNAATGGLTTTGTINGADSTSVFINESIFNYQNAIAPMATGSLYCNQAENTFVYGLSGAQNITVPSDPVSPGYYNLTLQGSGLKSLTGNTGYFDTYILVSPAKLNLNSYTLINL